MKQIKADKPSYKDVQKDLKNKLNMFDALPEKCSICAKAFDKKNKEMVQSWFVTVRTKENRVSLFCPNCHQLAKNVLEAQLKKEENEDDNSGNKNV